MAKPLPGRFNIKFQTWLNHKIWYQDHFEFWWFCWKVENKTNFQWFENWHKIQKSKLCAFYIYKWSPWHKSCFFQLSWYFEIFCPQALTLLATDSPPIDQRLALMPTYSLIIFLYQLTNNIYVKLPSYLGTSLATDSLGVKVSNQIWI